MSNFNNLICCFCSSEFIGRTKRKFCSMSCFGKSRIDIVVERNKNRRKYPSIPGFDKAQIFRYFNQHLCEKFNKIKRDKRIFLINFLGAKCNICGYKENMKALQVDHIKSDGHIQRKTKGMTNTCLFYCNNLHLVKENIQILCANCNKIKQIDSKEFNLKYKKRDFERIKDAIESSEDLKSFKK